MESKANYSRIDKSAHINWVLSALLGLFFFGGGNYMLKDFKQTVAVKKIIGSIGYFLCTVLLALFHIIELVIRKKSKSLCYPGSLYNREHGLVPGFTLGIFGGVMIFVAQVFLLVAWEIDPSSAGIVLLMLVATAPISSVLSYFLYKEKFKAFQIVGMTIALTGIILIGLFPILSSYKSGVNWLAILFGFLTITAYSIKNMNSRSMEVHNLDVYTAGTLNSIGEFLTCFVLLIYFYFNSEPIIFDKLLVYSIIGATLVALGQYSINQAIMTGNIGVVITIVNLSGIVFILLDFLFNGNVPDLMNLAFCLLSMFGVTIMLFGDNVWAKLKNS